MQGDPQDAGIGGQLTKWNELGAHHENRSHMTSMAADLGASHWTGKCLGSMIKLACGLGVEENFFSYISRRSTHNGKHIRNPGVHTCGLTLMGKDQISAVN